MKEHASATYKMTDNANKELDMLEQFEAYKMNENAVYRQKIKKITIEVCGISRCVKYLFRYLIPISFSSLSLSLFNC